jgi:hypothetical protein
VTPTDAQRAAAREFFVTYISEFTEGDVEALARLFARREYEARRRLLREIARPS